MARPLAAITGASSGIGAEFARKLATRYDLLLIARRVERLDALAAELTARHGCAVEVLVADLTESTQLSTVAEKLASVPELALLVNNAGFGARDLVWQSDIELLDRMHRLNVIAVLRLSHAALRNMIPRQAGAIINVASVAGFVRRAGSASYGATKAWVVAFTETLHLEMQSIGSPIRVQALCPGYTYSEFHDTMNVDRAKIASTRYWLSAESVVDASLRGLQTGRLFVIPGWRYWLIVNIISCMPLSWRPYFESKAPGKRKILNIR